MDPAFDPAFGPSGGGGGGAWTSKLKSLGVEAKRAAERTRHTVLASVGLSDAPSGSSGGGGGTYGGPPDLDRAAAAYVRQTAALRRLKADASDAFEALAKAAATSQAMSLALVDAAAAADAAGPPASLSMSLASAADALATADAHVADDALRRAERRLRRRVLAPLDEEVARGREVASRLDARRRCAADLDRYRSRLADARSAGGGVGANPFGSPGVVGSPLGGGGVGGVDADRAKAETRREELDAAAPALLDAIEGALPLRAALFGAVLSETVEMRRRFYADAARAFDQVVEVVGVDTLTTMRSPGGAAPAGVGGSGSLGDDAPLGGGRSSVGYGDGGGRYGSSANVSPADDDVFGLGGGGAAAAAPPRRAAATPASAANNFGESLWDEGGGDGPSSDDDDGVYGGSGGGGGMDGGSGVGGGGGYGSEKDGRAGSANGGDDGSFRSFKAAGGVRRSARNSMDGPAATGAGAAGRRRSGSVAASPGVSEDEALVPPPRGGSYPSAGVGKRETTQRASRSRPPHPDRTTTGSSYGERIFGSDPPFAAAVAPSAAAAAAGGSFFDDLSSGGGAAAPADTTPVRPRSRSRRADARSSDDQPPVRSSGSEGDLLADLMGDGGSGGGRAPTAGGSGLRRSSTTGNGHSPLDDWAFGASASASKATPTGAGHGGSDGDLLGSFSQSRSAPRMGGVAAGGAATGGDRRGGGGGDSSKRPPSSRASASNRSRASEASGSGGGGGGGGNGSGGGATLSRDALKKKHAAEIKARADEKLAAVREREQGEAAHQAAKDSVRSSCEVKINRWTAAGQRRGNLRALLATLDSVLYASSTWKPVTMETLAVASKVKVNYHKAILQVHPDKITQKGLSTEDVVLAELIFDELKNAQEVWAAELEGKPPPPGSVGPKGAVPSGGGGGGMFGRGGGMGGGMGGGGGDVYLWFHAGEWSRVMLRVVLPLLRALASRLVLPYLVVWGGLSGVLGLPHPLCAAVFRYAYAAAAVVEAGRAAAAAASVGVVALHDAVRDDRYLVGRRLYNYAPAAEEGERGGPALLPWEDRGGMEGLA